MIRLSSTIARGTLVAGLAGVLLGAACSSGSDGTGTAGAGGSSGGGTTGGSSPAGTSGGAGNGAAGTGVAGTGVAGSNAGSGGSGVAGSGGSGGSTAGTTGAAGSTAGTTGAGGSAAGTTGTGGGNAGRGGSAGGQAGQTGSAGRGGAAGSGTAGSGTAGSGGPPTCPANATFCSGFETPGLPAGAVYKLNGNPSTPFTTDYSIETAQKNSGTSSLRVKSAADTTTSGSAYKMLAVPAPMNAFWVRFFIRSDMPIGSNDHNAFAVASLTDEPNDSAGVEFAEDVGVSFNASDDVRWPTGYGRLTNGSTMPYSLPANTWHCVEISFDGTARVQQLFVNGMQLINASSYPSMTRAFKNFKFGFNSLHGPARNMWYDDVAVAPTRVGGCP